MNNQIVKRIYTIWKIRLDSPMNISGGDSILTDSDFQRNGDGVLFIPGTSVAGSFRSYLEQKKDEAGIFGYSSGEHGFMSKVFLSDIYFGEDTKLSVRDGICLDEDKIVLKEKKYDMEILETGACGNLCIECVIREEDREQDFYDCLHKIASGIQKGEIRFGAKKTRGFGKICLTEIYEQVFTEKTRIEWTNFLTDPENLSFYKKISVKEYLHTLPDTVGRYLKITVPLRQKGGISIRKYSAQPVKADYEHITCNGVPVIPGSSWNGAIRASAECILAELGCHEREVLLDKWFGYVLDKSKKNTMKKEKAHKSIVTVGESKITDTKDGKYVNMPIIRNRINRFDASTVNGALYSEIACFNGYTELELYIEKKEDWMALTALLCLIVKDIQNGYLAIGGQTAVGRGIFVGDGDVKYSEPVDEKQYMKELCRVMDTIEQGGNA